MPTELAPDVRARVRSREGLAEPDPAPTRPPAGRRRPVQRFGSTRVEAQHHWVLGTLVLLAALVALVVLLVT